MDNSVSLSISVSKGSLNVFELFLSCSNCGGCYSGGISIGKFLVGVGVTTGESWVAISVYVDGRVKVAIVISVIRTSSYSSVLISNSNTVRFRVGL